MTLSKGRRLTDQARVLKILATDLGDTRIALRSWNTDRHDLADVIGTTWPEFEEQGLLRTHGFFHVSDRKQITPGM